MAKDMLDAIYAAEESYRQRESEAKAQAAKSVSEAKQQADALISARVAKASQEADIRLADTKRQSEERLAQADADAQADCNAIAATAAKNRPTVIRHAADAILG